MSESNMADADVLIEDGDGMQDQSEDEDEKIVKKDPEFFTDRILFY